MIKEDDISYMVWALCSFTSVVILALMSTVCSTTALKVSKFYNEVIGSVELPLFSKMFLSGFTGIYLITYVPILWLIVIKVRRCGTNQLRILTVVTLAFGMLFLALYVCSNILLLTSLVITQ